MGHELGPAWGDDRDRPAYGDPDWVRGDGSGKHLSQGRSYRRLNELPHGSGTAELYLRWMDLDLDRPDRGVSHLDVAGQEGVHLVGDQHEGVLTAAETGLAEEELGENALYLQSRAGRGPRGHGLSGP